MFIDRTDAGNKLALELGKFKDTQPIILAIPRGGIVTAYETIQTYNFDWDLIIPIKKLLLVQSFRIVANYFFNWLQK